MLIGIRFLLLFAVLAMAVTGLGYLFTRNPRFLQLTRNLVKLTLLVAGLFALVFVLDRFLFI
ncbi:MAG: hypothetical protein HY255_02930 [Betaproteobacteria bacterium]|nr:hypothetical protein [Betaproteobacteria bacterium]